MLAAFSDRQERSEPGKPPHTAQGVGRFGHQQSVIQNKFKCSSSYKALFPAVKTLASPFSRNLRSAIVTVHSHSCYGMK